MVAFECCSSGELDGSWEWEYLPKILHTYMVDRVGRYLNSDVFFGLFCEKDLEKMVASQFGVNHILY